jgi:hypothetical protein
LGAESDVTIKIHAIRFRLQQKEETYPAIIDSRRAFPCNSEPVALPAIVGRFVLVGLRLTGGLEGGGGAVLATVPKRERRAVCLSAFVGAVSIKLLGSVC